MAQKTVFLPTTYVREHVLNFIRYCLKYQTIFDEYQWDEQEEKTKVYLAYQFPQEDIKKPMIIVQSDSQNTPALYLGQAAGTPFETWDTPKKVSPEYIIVTIRVRTHQQLVTEELTNYVKKWFEFVPLMNGFVKATNIVFNPVIGLRKTSITTTRLPETNKLVYEQSLSFECIVWWEITYEPTDVETIQGEIVSINREDC